ncbi:MAG: glycosyl hydrolase, partial [Draconibacterium sp.]|nr:glycosyl hydrolase [Draconibacterium sp.]
MKIFLKTVFLFVLIVLFSCNNKLEQQFRNPPREYGPMPFWHINGELTTDGIRQQVKDANDAGFTGITLLPLATWKNKVGTTPDFLSDEYFDRYQDMIDIAEELDMEVIVYDDNDFPTGMAGGKLGELFPQHTMKRLDKIETEINGPVNFTDSINAVKLMSAVAMNTKTLERIEISEFVKSGVLNWQVPEGNWKIMLFPMVKDSWHKAYPVVDYLDTTAVREMIKLTYDKYAEKFSSYFGNTIKITFFDDVGFWRHPRTWTGKFNEKFEELHGYDPRPFYPALWHNIGPETQSVRNAFYHTRAELLAEGFPKLAAEWNEKHGL